jgi:hypothetical protein
MAGLDRAITRDIVLMRMARSSRAMTGEPLTGHDGRTADASDPDDRGRG